MNGRADPPHRTEPPTDLELLRGMARAPEESLRILFHRWGPPLRRFLIRATGSRESGEDLLQEAFLRIFRAAPRLAPDSQAGSWMYRICANLAYSHWRRQRRLFFTPGPPAEIPAGREEGPDSRRMRGAFAQDLGSAIERLPANQRMVFLLKVDQGLTYQEIAAVLRCPEGTAKSRFHHAVRRLRGDLREWEGGLETGQAQTHAATTRPRNGG